MEETKVSLEVAKLLKEIGFNIFTGKAWIEKERQELFFTPAYIGVTNGIDYHAPTQALAQKWFREVHNIEIFTHLRTLGVGYVVKVRNMENTKTLFQDVKPTYEEALEEGLKQACLIKLIELCGTL